MDQLSVMDRVSGVELTRPATGERIRLVKTGADTGGAFVEGVSAYPPTLAETALHEHPHQVERLEVVSGTLYVRWAGKQQLVGAGKTLVIPPGEAHEITSAGAETAEVIWQFIPALRTDAFLRTALDVPEREVAGRFRRLARRLAVAAEFSDEYRRATLPWVVQWPFFALLKVVNRSLKQGNSLRSNGGARGIDLFGERIGC